MIIDLRLQNFRSYDDASFEFGENVNIIVGPNGSGKTNLLESIQVAATGSSYRVSDGELVRQGADWARIDMQLEPHEEVRTLRLTLQPRPTKAFEINDKRLTRLAPTHKLPVVLFEPNHLQLLHGAPEARRAYLDDILETIQPNFAAMRRNYRRVLSQRNTLLKRGKISQAEMFPWNLRLSELGAVIARSRAELVTGISPQINELYKTLSSTSDEVVLIYEPQFPVDSYETSMFSKLESHLERDIERGFTAYGPHREDMYTSMNTHPIPEVASRGETRTIILALKIIELTTIEKTSGKSPILLLDDVFSELDGARRRLLTAYLQNHQTFLTTTDADVVVKHFTDSTILPLG